jgi:hypothetical protein
MASQGAGDVVVKGSDVTYVGQVRAGTETPHGRGVYTWADGNRYEGEWRDGEMHGRGVFTWTNGRRYEGEYLDGWMHGRGIFTWTNGGRYEGEYRDGKMHGRGVFWFADGRVFDGAWAGDRPLRGTVMAADRALSLAVFDGKTNIGDGWDKAARVAAGRVVEGRPGWDGGGVWRGTVEDAAGARYAGELRWLRPCGEGVLTAGGARFRVAHADGAATLAEGDAPGRMPARARKEVRARATVAAAAGRLIRDCIAGPIRFRPLQVLGG